MSNNGLDQNAKKLIIRTVLRLRVLLTAMPQVLAAIGDSNPSLLFLKHYASLFLLKTL